MKRRRPPHTANGYVVAHDLRTVEWTRWRETPPEEQDEILAEVTTYLDEQSDASGELGLFSIVGHAADLMILVMRPDLEDIDLFQRQFEQLQFADYTTRVDSAVGLTEASGYTEAAEAYFDPDQTADPGISRYIETRLYPSIPDAAVVSYYPMSKRRDSDANWYDLPYDERAAHVISHGEIGKQYAGQVTQVITGTIGFEAWEWGVTLFATEMAVIKELLTEMRYDPSTSHFAEFGPFYLGRPFTIEDMDAFMAGEPIRMEDDEPSAPSVAHVLSVGDGADFPDDAWVVVSRSTAPVSDLEEALLGLEQNFDHYDSHLGSHVLDGEDNVYVVSGWETERAAETAAGFIADLPGAEEPTIGTSRSSVEAVESGGEAADSIRDVLADRDVYAGQPHGEDVHALVLYADGDTEDLVEAVDELRDGFDRYDTHEWTKVYQPRSGDPTAVVSLWATPEAADRAADYLVELPGVYGSSSDENGFSTMGMFYTVKPSHRQDFLETFDTVEGVLEEMEGHRQTELFINIDDDCDTFIASRWDSKEAALTFFRSDAFRDTVSWGRDVLADRPRHVFLV